MEPQFQNVMTEEGMVRSLHGGLAQVEAVEGKGCESCSAKGACHSLSADRKRQVPALNLVKAEVGDRVLIVIPKKAALGAGFLVYIVPIIALILGAVAGQNMAPHWGWGPQNGAVVLGLLSLAACWMALRQVSKRLGKRSDFSVKIVKVINKGEADAVDQHSAGLRQLSERPEGG